MNKKLFFGSFIFLMLVCQILTSCADGYKIIGNVPELADGTQVYLRLVGPPSKDIDSVCVKDGYFEFTGSSVEKPLWALIVVKGRFVSLCDFYLENGTIEVKGESSYKAIASGTPRNDQYHIYNRGISVYNDSLYNISLKISLSEKEVNKACLIRYRDQLQKEMEEKEIDFIKTYPDSPISLRIVSYRSSKASSQHIEKMISYLDSKMLQEQEIIRIKDYAERLAKTEAGVIAPDFTLTTIEGEEFILSRERGKYLLLDFWASWCMPCRASFPTIAAIHEQYEGERFSVIGISLDKNQEAWKKALEEEGCGWKQRCDSEGDVANKYAISTIPALLLIGPDGRIVGRFDKNGIVEKLKQVLAE